MKKLLFSHFSVNKGLIQHVVQSCYNYNLTFRKLEIHTVKMRPLSACYTSGRCNSIEPFLGFGRCTNRVHTMLEQAQFNIQVTLIVI